MSKGRYGEPPFTSEEAVKRVQKGNFKNIEFSLPDIYGTVWQQLDPDCAGIFGREFNRYIIKYPNYGIKYIGKKGIKPRAIYVYIK